MDIVGGVMKKIILSLELLLLVASPCVFSQSGEPRIALVIGNGSYANSPLRNPPNDATDVAASLKSLDFSVTTLIDSSRREMTNAIRDFGLTLKQGGVGLFYYAGHGVQVDGRNFLIPINADIKQEDEVEFEAIDVGLILNKMESAKNRINIIILDACRDNPFARSFRSGSRGLAQMEAPRGSLIVYATGPGAVAADGEGRNGLFTEALLKHIDIPGIEVEQMLKNVRRDVVASSGGNQIPWSSSSLTGSVVLMPGDEQVKQSLQLILYQSRGFFSSQYYLFQSQEYPIGFFGGFFRGQRRLMIALDESGTLPLELESRAEKYIDHSPWFSVMTIGGIVGFSTFGVLALDTLVSEMEISDSDFARGMAYIGVAALSTAAAIVGSGLNLTESASIIRAYNEWYQQ